MGRVKVRVSITLCSTNDLTSKHPTKQDRLSVEGNQTQMCEFHYV